MAAAMMSNDVGIQIAAAVNIAFIAAVPTELLLEGVASRYVDL